MPNWVMNSLSITGSPEVIAQMKAQLSAPYETQYYNFIKDEIEIQKVEQPFSFWNIYRDWETDRKSTRLNSSHRL